MDQPSDIDSATLLEELQPNLKSSAPKLTETEQALLAQLHAQQEQQDQLQSQQQQQQQKPKARKPSSKRSGDPDSGASSSKSGARSHRRMADGIINTSNGDVLSLDQILEEARLAEEASQQQITDGIVGSPVTGIAVDRTITNSGLCKKASQEESINSSTDESDEVNDLTSTVFPANDSNPHNAELISRTRRKRTRTVTSPYQGRVLRKVLSQTQFPSTVMRENLAKALGMTPRTVQIWFQNQRQKAKNRQSQQQEKWSVSNIFFHNLTVLPSHHGPNHDRPSTQITLLPPTTEDPSKIITNSNANKKRRISGAASAANIAASKPVTTKPGPGRPPKKQHPQQFIMTTTGADVVTSNEFQSSSPPPSSAAASIFHTASPSFHFLDNVHGLDLIQPWTTANLQGLQSLPAYSTGVTPFSVPAVTSAGAGATQNGASTEGPYNYMLVPELDLLASAALEEQEQGFTGQQQGAGKGKKGKTQVLEREGGGEATEGEGQEWRL